MTATQQEQPPPLPVVWHPDDMDNATFIKHMNARHSHSLGKGFARLPDQMTPAMILLYRIFHRQLHGILAMYHPDLNHEHEA